jgi:hypothetical protein
MHRESTCKNSVIQQSRWLETDQLGVSHCLCIHTGASGSKWVVGGESSDDCGSCSSCNAQRRSFGNPCPGISRTCCNSSRSNPLTAKRHRCSTSPIFGRQTLQNCQKLENVGHAPASARAAEMKLKQPRRVKATATVSVAQLVHPSASGGWGGRPLWNHFLWGGGGGDVNRGAK